jgi:hypothetical protein
MTPRAARYRNRRVRILHYLGDDRFEILLGDDSRRSVGRAELTFIK